MIIDGEKWACEACVRGHRVSNCNHNGARYAWIEEAWLTSVDRPLVHVNKKGRPVSQCAHCRGLRKTRTTHNRCECGDKKKKQKREADAVDKEDRQRCGCPFGLRCTCALKKEPLGTVPETGLPPSRAAERKKPQLTATKSESTLATVRDGHKPARHNDMAHTRGMPYTIPRSQTVHSTPNARSSDDLPLELAGYRGRPVGEPQRLVKSEHDTPESAPVLSTEDASVPSLDLAGLFPSAHSMVESPEGPSGLLMPNSDDELDQLASSVAPPMSLPSFPTTEASPLGQLTFHDPYQEAYHASSDNDLPVGSGFSAPPVDWSSFPIHPSDFSATASTQPPSYASLDYSYCSSQPGLPAPPSSGEMSELDEFGPLSNLNRTSDLRDSSDSDATQLRINTSTYMSMPQTQLVSATNLDSVDIDEFLRSANESTAAMEQFQANIRRDSKPPSPESEHEHGQATVPMATSTDPIWSSNLYASGASSTMDENFFPNSWGHGRGPS